MAIGISAPRNPFYTAKGERNLGRFASEFGGSIDFYGVWVPDPNVEADLLMRVASYLANTNLPMVEALEIARQDTEKRFETGTDPEEEPWQELTIEYAKEKTRAGFGDEETLTRTGLLAAAAPGGWQILGDSLIYNPKAANLPEYGYAHQEGQTMDVFLDAGKTGTQETLPARPFIGLSLTAIEEIEAVFVNWFENYEEVVHVGGGVVENLGANRLGRLPIIGHTKTGQPRLSSGQFGRRT